jgi:tRNA wybutosine-synthesizing protein 4
MSAEGVIIADLWLWEISCEAGVALLFEDLSERVAIEARCTFPRFGAQMVAFEGEMLLMGGVAPGRVPEDKDEILVITPAGQVQRLHVEASSGSRPLLIGFGAAATASGDIFIVGGGSTCSSMGTCWNTDAFLLTRGSAGKTGNWHLSTHRVEEAEQEQVPTRSKHVNGNIPTGQTNGSISATTKPPTVKQIPRLRITAEKEFTEIISRGEPVVLEGMDLGPCTHQWTPAYLEQKIGADRTVIIHSCSTDRMTFQTKNFSYLKSPFGEFINSVSHGAQSYLRSVSTIQPGKHPTLLSRDFPTISPDFHLPPIFHSINETIHSSPLRISGPLTLWLHYDVLANILCQIRGTKTLRLYPPADAPHLSFPPGGSSSNIDVFGAIAANPALAHTHPQEARMGPGDVLFIPPMWAHAARPTGGMSVAVNVFWRNLERGVYAVGRDVYGNRDLAAYESGRKEVERVVKGFEGVPVEVARFYLGRLVEELKGKVQEYGGDRGDEAQEFRGANT